MVKPIPAESRIWKHWFRAFGKARNTIIHEGVVPELTYSGSNSNYDGPFFFTAEFLLRGVIKVLLSKLGYGNAWQPEAWRNYSGHSGGIGRDR